MARISCVRSAVDATVLGASRVVVFLAGRSGAALR
jgi:hypothetical protein